MINQRIHNRKPSPGKLYRKKLARILKSYRRLQGITRKTVQSRLLAMLKEHEGEPQWDQFRNLVDPVRGGSLVELEEGGIADETICLPDIQLLADAYRLADLILDPARSKPMKSMISIHKADTFLEVNKEGVPYYGYNAQYFVPQSQLDGTENVGIVYFKLDEKGHSYSHSHPGEEIIYLEKGLIEIRFEDTGLRTRLEADSLIHFEARNGHNAWNLSTQTAECFVIRFSQPELRTPPKLKRPLRVRPLSRESTKVNREVLDRSSFGRFLQLLCSERVRGIGRGNLSLTDLARRSNSMKKDAGYSFSRSKLARIQRGEAPVLEEELPQLAKIYEIEPMVLYNFLLKNFPDAIAIHGEQDMDEISAEFLPPGVTYRLPRRRLSSSNMTIALLTLDKKAVTNSNQHPGQELIKPLKGKVAIEFGSISTTVERGHYAHFYSHLNHRARNVGDEPATILSIRLIY